MMSKIKSAAVANQSEAMETGDHFKNGAISKSQTSRGNSLTIGIKWEC